MAHKHIQWWRNLSINQQKEIEKKHFPDFSSYLIHVGIIREMWEKEGKPEPQELIQINQPIQNE